LIERWIDLRLSEIHPIFYHARIEQKRLFRTIADLKDRKRFAKTRELNSTFPYTCKKHQSLLRRKLGNSDPRLQENKITNLKIATGEIDGVIIKPGESFPSGNLSSGQRSQKFILKACCLKWEK